MSRCTNLVSKVFALLILAGIPTSLLDAQSNTFTRPSFGAFSYDASGFYATLNGQAGLIHSLHVSTNFLDWLTIATNVGADSWNYADFTRQTGSARFFKIHSAAYSSVFITNYHGWANSIILNNGRAEVLVVPAIGRVMQFRFSGDNDGPFWENRALDGQAPSSSTWKNFGGDKTWPAPQTLWGWPPPPGFDGSGYSTTVTNGRVTIVSPIDSRFGIQTSRTIELHPTESTMLITTGYEKKAAGTIFTNQVSIWTVTQLKHPERIFVPLVAQSNFSNGYQLQSATPPPDLLVSNGLISLSRDPTASHKIGTDAGKVLWVGAAVSVLIESLRLPSLPATDYPDKGSSAEIYTNNDPEAYVELEMLGPLRNLPVGQRIERIVVYRLIPRTETTVDAEARKILFGQ